MTATKNYFLLFIFLIIVDGYNSQKLDSLINIYNTSKIDTVRCNVLLSALESDNSSEKTKDLCNKLNSLIISKTNTVKSNKLLYDKYRFYESVLLHHLGLLEQNNDNFKEAINYYNKSLTIKRELSNQEGIGENLISIATAKYFIGEINESVKLLEESYKIFTKLKDDKTAAFCLNYLAGIYQQEGNIPLAIENFYKSLKLRERLLDSSGIANVYSNLASLYITQNDSSKGIQYLIKSEQIYSRTNNKSSLLMVKNNLGSIYRLMNDTLLAHKYYTDAFKIAKELGSKRMESHIINGLGMLSFSVKNYSKAIEYFKVALLLSDSINDKNGLANANSNLAKVYYLQNNINESKVFSERAYSISKEMQDVTSISICAKQLYLIWEKLKNPNKALQFYKEHIQLRDSTNNIITQKASIQSQFQYDYDKKTLADSLKIGAERKETALTLKAEKTKRTALYIGLFLVAVFSIFMYNRFRVTQKQKVIIAREKERSEELLLNILPSEVAEELKTNGEAEAKLHNEVSVLFTDFKGFTQLSEGLSAKELIAELNHCFVAFDNIIHKHNIEKIKTIGDAYMAVSGLPIANPNHAIDMVNAAIEIRDFMQSYKEQRINESKKYFELRIGIHSGDVVAGIVGIKKFAYDVWGDTVNTAARMESSGEVGKVNISETTFDLIKNEFRCEPRGFIEAKGKGKMSMYFIERHSTL